MSGTLSTRSKAKMTGLDSAKPPKGSILVHLLALSVMGFVVTAHGKLPEVSAVQNDTPNAPPAFYILGDSSVDCGDNTLFYPLVHSFLSLYSCNGSSDASLIPHLLGNSYYSRSVSFLSFFLDFVCDALFLGLQLLLNFQVICVEHFSDLIWFSFLENWTAYFLLELKTHHCLAKTPTSTSFVSLSYPTPAASIWICPCPLYC